ncbi:MAG: ribosome bioproteinis GTP-binding protein YlqF [Fusobacteria bacterium]|nr:MAG: ribosome bioproteinis GTP-binding protein YlqF [Fusobacteriota bacterium]KAF0229856.1 MAG: ribosome bioproteinis GTP-binding protein [Fusobacteriota bacterium]
MFKVQWYPGHMTRAKRKIENIIKTIDIIIELRDARIPMSSGNPDISKMALGKGHLIILTKPDLADKNITEQWIELYKEKDINMITIKGIDTQDVKKIIKQLENIADKVFEKRRKKGLLDRPVRCMVLGVSNVGKSSLINSLALKKVAVTGNKPGVTKGNQWVRISKKLELLDTPGILWPKFDGLIGVNLALTGAISDNVYDIKEAAVYLIKELKEKKYISTSLEPLEELMLFGEKRGILLKGGNVDLEKSALLYLKDFRSGKLGHISLEWPMKND